ncbi:MAG: gamma-glutamyltransferase [Pseudomonadota bacterium]
MPATTTTQRLRAALAAVLAGLTLGAAAQVPTVTDRPAQPEADTGRSARDSVRARQWMAVTAHPLATDAARQMIERGGSAVDAAIAAQLMLTLVEPQSSGLGGGGFLLHHDPTRGTLDAWDGRETAPAALSDDIFLTPDGRPKRFHDAAVGGLAVGVPGLLAMLAEAHAAHGRLPWASLFAPAIKRARDGFPVTKRLHALIAKDRFLRLDPVAAAYFYTPTGQARAVGERLKNPQLADSLEVIARDGPAAFYQGELAADLVRRVREHPVNPGRLSRADLAQYRPIRRAALCTAWRELELCGMPPPSSGAIAVAQILNLFGEDSTARLTQASGVSLNSTRTGGPSTHDPDQRLRLDPAGVHRFLEAARLSFADRARYVGDPAFTAVPTEALLDRRYLRERARLIGPQAMGLAPPGDPERGHARADARQSLDLERESTTHLAVVDAAGRVVSMTTSIEDVFGARLMVRGFLLNNQLTDFSFVPREEGRAIANRVEPGKRPRSSMAPTLVFERPASGHPVPGSPSSEQGSPPPVPRTLRLALGSPGGASIIAYVARVLQMSLAEDVPLQQAIEAGHFGNRNGPSELEAGTSSEALASDLKARGHTLRPTAMTSGLHGILRRCSRQGDPVDAARSGASGSMARQSSADCWYESGVDPRREGQAFGR